MAHRVVFAPEARDDLLQLYGYIAQRSGAARALAFIGRIVAHCEGLVTFSERGTKRDDLRPGLRVTSLKRRVTIAFHVAGETVTIDRILYAGRDLGAELGGDAGI